MRAAKADQRQQIAQQKTVMNMARKTVNKKAGGGYYHATGQPC